jgi:chemotaxis protein MotB
MSQQPEQASEGAPEWMVSYADMITIMMAFFVVLYASTSASGTKDKGGKQGEQAKGGKEPAGNGKKTVSGNSEMTDERLQKVIESLTARFGSEWTVSNLWNGGAGAGKKGRSPGDSNDPNNSRNKKPNRGTTRENYAVLAAPKPNENIVAGGRVYFDESSVGLGEEQAIQLRAVAAELAGKLQKIEVRGHTGRRPLPKNSPYHDHWDLAYARCRAVQDSLIAQGIDPQRIRLSVAGTNEPIALEGDPLKIQQNSRVDIRLLNEWTGGPTGVPEAGATPGEGSEGK